VAIAEGRADIRWQGFVTPKDFFRQIDVLVVPSLWQDPAPLVVLECLTAGIPLIGSRLGGIPELMGDGTGWLFNPGDPVALELALQNAIELRKQLSSMGACASKRAASFSIQVMIDGYLQAFSRAIDKAGHR
jgi:glycosyltransferase involved in cell wall biosynthesis